MMMDIPVETKVYRLEGEGRVVKERDKRHLGRQEIYDKLVGFGVRHPLVVWGWSARLLKEGWFYVEFNGNAEWLAESAQEALEKIDVVFSE